MFREHDDHQEAEDAEEESRAGKENGGDSKKTNSSEEFDMFSTDTSDILNDDTAITTTSAPKLSAVATMAANISEVTDDAEGISIYFI